MSDNPNDLLVESGFAVSELLSLSAAMDDALLAGERPAEIIYNTLYALARLVHRNAFVDAYNDADNDMNIDSAELLEWLENVKPEGRA